MGIMVIRRVTEREVTGRAGMEKDLAGTEVSKELLLGAATLGVIMGTDMACFRERGRIESIWRMGFGLRFGS